MRPRDLLIELIDDLGSEGSRVKGAGDLDVKVTSDAELIRVALRPLVENALTYGAAPSRWSCPCWSKVSGCAGRSATPVPG